MPRQRRTRPQNMGQNRNVAMRNNARKMPFQQGNFQGGIGQNPGIGQQQPGQQRPGTQQGNIQCPVGQQPGRRPDGSMGCVPAAGPGQVGAPQRTGAGIPGADRNKPNKQGI